VVLASELAGELGPIVHYATARVITANFRRGATCLYDTQPSGRVLACF